MKPSKALIYIRALTGMPLDEMGARMGLDMSRQGIWQKVMRSNDLKISVFISACNALGYEVVLRGVDRTLIQPELLLTNEDMPNDPSDKEFSEIVENAKQVGKEQKAARKKESDPPVPKKKRGRKFVSIPQTYAPAPAPAPEPSTFADPAPLPAEILTPDPTDGAPDDSGEPSSKPKQSPW